MKQHYELHDLLTYNRILNFLIGARGIGKTYSIKEHCINRFLKTGEQFIYVRRFKTELKKLFTFFSDISPEFKDHKFSIKGTTFYIDKKIAGYAIPLTNFIKEKSSSYDKVTTIFFDEFLIENSNLHYLPNEPLILLNLMDSVIRNRNNVRVICASNAVSIVNPYFVYFNIKVNTNVRFTKHPDKPILVEIPQSGTIENARKTTQFGKLINDTSYDDFATKNKFVNDRSDFIKQRSKKSNAYITIFYNGTNIGIWFDKNNGEFYASNKFDNTRPKFAMSKEDMRENIYMMNNWKKSVFLKLLVKSFQQGILYFENQNIKNLMYNMFGKMNIR